MSDIIFVVPDEYPDYYATYTDYYKLAALSGFQLRRRSEMDITNPAHCYIVTWFDVQHGGWQGAKARIILWNLEWATAIHPLDKVGYITPETMIPGVAEIWSPDAGFAARNQWRYVPVGSHPKLVYQMDLPALRIEYDVTLQMYRDPPRRRTVIDALKNNNVRIAPDGWGQARHLSLIKSRMQVHIHQHDHMNTVSPLRFAVCAAYQKPIITETIDHPGIYAGAIIQANYGELVNAVLHWKQVEYTVLLDMSRHLYQTLCIDNTFGSLVNANV